MSKVVLGKGLEALIPSEGRVSLESRKYRMVGLDKIAPNPMQPRRDFDQQSLEELAQSFREKGIIQPLVLQQSGSGFTIIAGERRFRAARLAGMVEVPAVLMENVNDTQLLELALVENIQREDLNPMETAEAYRRLVDECGLTQNELASKVGKSRAAVANVLRLNSLPMDIKNMIREGRLTEGHARAILSLDNEPAMLRMADQILNQSLTVREAEHVTSRAKKRRLVPKKKLPALMEIENYLKRLLGTSVKINHGLKRGRVEIEYYSDEDLERLLDLFKKIEN